MSSFSSSCFWKNARLPVIILCDGLNIYLLMDMKKFFIALFGLCINCVVCDIFLKHLKKEVLINVISYQTNVVFGNLNLILNFQFAPHFSVYSVLVC